MRDTLEQMNKNVSQMKTSQQGETDAAQASARTALAEEVGAAQNSMAAADRSLREGWANADRIFDYLKGQVQHFALVLDSGDHGTYSALNGGREDANAVMLESHGLSHWMDTHLDAEVFSTSKLIEALDGWADKFAEDERDAEMQNREAEYRSAARTNEFITQMASGLGGAQQSKPQSQETPGGKLRRRRAPFASFSMATVTSEVNTELNLPPKLGGARSRLYRRRFLQVNTRWESS